MNFLAHIYLSGVSDEMRIGNFIGDWVKGKNFEKYPDKVKEGILLHRKIDNFTDHHPVPRFSAKRLQPKYDKYAGVVVDVIYDHFLAKFWSLYSHERLHSYVLHCYRIFISHYGLLPVKGKRILPYLVASNRLESYIKIEGIERSLHLMVGRTSLPAETDFAIEILRNNYDEFSQEFLHFFPQIIDFVKNECEVVF